MDKAKDYAVRNRENQRRSRARRKVYIAELEQRVWTLEHEGIKATMEMQLAARKVAEENRLLRQLLDRHGVSNAEVEICLRETTAGGRCAGEDEYETKLSTSCRLGGQRHALALSANVSSPKLLSHPAIELQEPLPAQRGDSLEEPGPSQSHSHQITPSNRDSSARPRASCLRPFYEPSSADSKQSKSRNPEWNHPLASSPPISEDKETKPSEQLQSSSPTNVRHIPRACSRSTASRSPSPDTTTCEAAAIIIANMRGNPDPEAVWPELGCGRSGRCMVKNATIFQLA